MANYSLYRSSKYKTQRGKLNAKTTCEMLLLKGQDSGQGSVASPALSHPAPCALLPSLGRIPHLQQRFPSLPGSKAEGRHPGSTHETPGQTGQTHLPMRLQSSWAVGLDSPNVFARSAHELLFLVTLGMGKGT